MSANATTPSPAETYEQFFGPAIFSPWARVLLDYAVAKPGERVLDLACGTGIVAQQVAPQLGAAGRVLGVDISPDMLAVASAKPRGDGAPIKWRQGDACQLELDPDRFDLVLCQQGFQFFPDRDAAARGIRGVLADGGRAVLSVWCGLDRNPVFKALFEAEARHLGEPIDKLAVPFSVADGETLRDVFGQAGFTDISIDTETRDVSFASTERFFELTILAGAAVIPALAEQDAASRAALVAAVAAEAEGMIGPHLQGDHLVFPMTSHMVVAR
jgi:ubiquinone/menaquinone biosynthesis C-methylase UbiE